MKHLFLMLFLAMALPSFAQTTLDNGNCGLAVCTSYNSVPLVVTNSPTVKHIEFNTVLGFFETLDANQQVIDRWNDLTVTQYPNTKLCPNDPGPVKGSFNGGADSTEQQFHCRYYRGWQLVIDGGTSILN
jgi:hypothetical protein